MQVPGLVVGHLQVPRRTNVIGAVGRAVIVLKTTGGIAIGIVLIAHFGTDSVDLSVGILPVSWPRPRRTNTTQVVGRVVTAGVITVGRGAVGHLGTTNVGAVVGD